MLDQNTDRMWYVIGAVIVGAAIIFLVNSSFPQLFASVGDTFTKKVDETSEVISDIDVPIYGDGYNLFEPLGLTYPSWSNSYVTSVAGNYIGVVYVSLEELGLLAGDVVTFSTDYEFGEYSLAHRVMFTPFKGEPDDEREINVVSSKRFTGTGRMSHTVTIPEKSNYFLLRFENKRFNDQNETFNVKIRRLKLEKGSIATPF